MDEIAAAPREIDGPCLLNVVRGGKTPEIDGFTARNGRTYRGTMEVLHEDDDVLVLDLRLR